MYAPLGAASLMHLLTNATFAARQYTMSAIAMAHARDHCSFTCHYHSSFPMTLCSIPYQHITLSALTPP
jgi:hypothetical protein